LQRLVSNSLSQSMQLTICISESYIACDNAACDKDLGWVNAEP